MAVVSTHAGFCAWAEHLVLHLHAIAAVGKLLDLAVRAHSKNHALRCLDHTGVLTSLRHNSTTLLAASMLQQCMILSRDVASGS